MKTLDKLQLAFELMRKAEDIINEIRFNKDDNESLLGYYGYGLEIIQQQLDIYTDNSRYYLTRNTNLEEILNSEGDNWEDESKDDEISYEDILEEIYI
jgi:hypothetical protein